MKRTDPINLWFNSAQELNEYIGIRFGQLKPGTERPEWFFLPHTQYDGIGGFAELLRKNGASIKALPKIKHFSSPSKVLPLARMLPKYLSPRKKIKWGNLEGSTAPSSNSKPPDAVAWHIFNESNTTQIRHACRKLGVTVNSFLLKHLTKSIRPFLDDQSATIPWMIPVNLRGKVTRDRDTANYSTYIGVKVRSFETVPEIHRNIYSALSRNEHWANWFAYYSGSFLTGAMRRYLISIERCVSESVIGSFSNLGDWDPNKEIDAEACKGGWLFSPPVLRFALLGAGCVTFQNQLSITIQAHPELTSNPKVTESWMHHWVKEIKIDLASLLTEPVDNLV